MTRTTSFLTRSACLATALISAVGAAPPALSPEEARVVAAVAGRSDEALALLERVVNIPSATGNVAGVRRVGDVFRAEFDRLGFTTRWAEMPPAMRRAGHLIAERRGTRGKRLLLIGHLDTVLEGVPYSRAGNSARGNGVSDMKGGDVIIVHALKALRDAGALDGLRLTVVLTGDEEDAGLPLARSRADLVEAAGRSDLALAFEEMIDDTATVARRGVSNWYLEATGKTGHSSGIFSKEAGAGAIFEAARILDAFRRELPEKALTFNPSVLAGGTAVEFDAEKNRGVAEGKTNVRPGKVVVAGDLRFVSPEQKRKAEDGMRRIVARHLPHTSAAITFTDEYPAMAPLPANYAALEVLSRASQDLGLGPLRPLDPGLRGAGDISFVSPPVPGLDGLGGNGEHSHSPDETLDLASFPDQVRRAALLLYRLTRDPEPAARPAPTVRLAFVGDLMLDRTPGRRVAEGADPFAHVAAALDDADLTVGNLECVVATGGERVEKPYNFRADPRAIPLLARHFDAVSLANNHTGDFGPGALVEMLERLDAARLPHFGAGRNAREAHAPWVVEKNGLKVAVLGYNEFKPRAFAAGAATPGCAWSDDPEVVADIKAVRPRADLVLTFMHWGHEYEPEPSERQKSLARLMIDAGADAVIGGHPHVVEGFERYRGKPIAYSLGNFVFDDFKDVEDPALREPSRTGWILKLTMGRSGLVSWETTVTRTDDDGFPRVVPGASGPSGADRRAAAPETPPR